jgi:hypothetical protein
VCGGVEMYVCVWGCMDVCGDVCVCECICRQTWAKGNWEHERNPVLRKEIKSVKVRVKKKYERKKLGARTQKSES